jgi:predicted enzyme related to lactoylglutathione lyase
MNMTSTRNPVGWFEIHVADMQRAKAFYEAVFKRPLFPLETGDESYTMQVFAGDVQSAGATGALVQHSMRQPTTEGVMVYFSCEDCAVESQLAIDLGGCVFKPKRSIGNNGFIAIIGDTEGNAIGLHSIK